MTWRDCLGTVVYALLVATAGVAQGQPGAPTSLPSAAAVDTVTAELHGPRGWPTPTALTIWPAEPRFGEAAALLLDFPAEVRGFRPDSLATTGQWLDIAADPARGSRWRHPFGGGAPKQLADGAPEPAAGAWRAVVPLRIYATSPAQIVWRDGPGTGVFPVRGRLATTEKPAAVRDPRDLGWYAGRIVVALLALAAIAAAGFWIRRRLRRGTAVVDRPLPAPDWMAAAIDLWRLEQEDLPARGEGRAFLDRLAGILRAYLAARFYLPACESTAAELAMIIEGCGWPVAPLRDFVALIAAADGDRFAPGRIEPARCRADLTRAVALISAVRSEPRYTPVPAALRVEAEAAWSGLCRGLPGELPGKVAA